MRQRHDGGLDETSSVDVVIKKAKKGKKRGVAKDSQLEGVSHSSTKDVSKPATPIAPTKTVEVKAKQADKLVKRKKPAESDAKAKRRLKKAVALKMLEFKRQPEAVTKTLAKAKLKLERRRKTKLAVKKSSESASEDA